MKIYLVMCEGVEWSHVEAVFKFKSHAKDMCDHLNENNTKPDLQGYVVDEHNVLEKMTTRGQKCKTIHD